MLFVPAVDCKISMKGRLFRTSGGVAEAPGVISKQWSRSGRMEGLHCMDCE